LSREGLSTRGANSKIRAEKDNPEQRYNDFWDWLLTGWHPIWLISTVIAYVYYLMTTEEV